MARRIHVVTIVVGLNRLDTGEAHHARDVLRLSTGTEVELFDDAGRSAVATIEVVNSEQVAVRVRSAEDIHTASRRLTIVVAAAVPKGDRAEWMVEKLSELGVDRFIPLAATRSVVLPAGKNKAERWVRIATEAAKQSHRSGVMTIGELATVPQALAMHAQPVAWHLSTADVRTPIATALPQLSKTSGVALFIGPEGGWTPEETEAFLKAGVVAVGLTESVLRVETAAVIAAGVVACGVGGSALERDPA